MATQLIKKSLRLFGTPYQFIPSVDPRLDGVSSTVGNKYLQNILLEGPVCTIIPGEPKYLPGQSGTDSKITTTAALLESASSGFNSLKDYINKSTDDDFRLYDFKRSYTEYMKYVNILCRAGATFLELDTKIDGTPLQQYDWRNYRQNSSSYSTIAGTLTSSLGRSIRRGMSALKATVTGKEMLYETSGDDDSDSVEDKLANYNYVQFYIDPDVSCDENISNNTGESQLKSMFDSSSSYLKEVAFMANSGGVDSESIAALASSMGESLNTGIQSVVGNNTITSALSRIINLGSSVIKGENVIMPDIYQNSSYSKSYSITIHLKSPYGTKLGYYLDIFVPMMHLLALAVPRQKSANTYGSPFLVKAYVEGIFTCNMGMVNSINITKVAESFTVDGLPTEVDVTLNIADLYSDLTLSPQNSPIMFVNNSSLVEYLATNCGLSIVAPNISTKAELTVNTITNAFKSIPSNITSGIKEAIDNEITKFTQLTW